MDKKISLMMLRPHSFLFRYAFAISVGSVAIVATYLLGKTLHSELEFIGIFGIAWVSLTCGLAPAILAIVLVTTGFAAHSLLPALSLPIQAISSSCMIRLGLFDLLAIASGLLGFVAREGVARERQLSENLRQERVLREQFVSTLAHDLRSPLMSASMSIEILAGNRVAQADRRDALFKVALANVKRIDKMIQDLLDANRIEAGGRFPIKLEKLEMGAIVREFHQQLEFQYDRQILLRQQSGARGYWSPDCIWRILENLVSNALKYGDPSTPVTIAVEDAGERVRLSVHNFGKPFSPAEKSCLFQPFFRTKSATNSGKAGWGLGLILVRGFAEAHGGFVTVESDMQKGTTFTIDLPLDARPFQPAAMEERKVS